MASHFTGLTIQVLLREPPNVLVQGLVASVVEQTSTLILQNVYFPSDGRRMPTCSVDGAQIADIKIIDSATPAPQPQAQPPIVQNAVPNAIPGNAAVPATPASAQTTPTPASRPFVDPAIMSMGRPPSQPPAKAHTSFPLEAPSTPLKMAAAAQAPTHTSPFVGVAKQPSSASSSTKKRNDPATLTAPFSGLNIENAQNLEADDSDEQIVGGDGVRRASITKTRTGKPMDDGPGEGEKKTRRGKRGNKKKEQNQSVDLGISNLLPEAARKPQENQGGTYRGKGWRQTPILQETALSPQRTPGIISGKVGQQAITASRKKAKRQKALEAHNGWATEDATDIQELPEFDFASNLSKFDKRSVFDQIRNEDTTADEDRLVSFNRLPARPGTYGGKNLHPTENVLEGSVRGGRGRGSQSDSSTEEFDFDSGRNSRRAMSRTSNKRVPLRSNSMLGEDSPAAGAHSSGHSAAAIRSRSIAGLNIPRSSYSSHSHGSPNPNIGSRFTPPTSPSFDRTQHLFAPNPQFRLTNSNRSCPTVTPAGMLAVEEIAEVEFGIPAEILNENAGRGIAEVVLAGINPGGRRLARENLALNARPVCAVFVGNHKAGARAIAASRHLLGRGVRVIVCVLGYERAGSGLEIDKEVRQQLDIFRKLGGTVKCWTDVKRLVQRGDVPVELVLDALLTSGKMFDGLGPEDQRVAADIISWVGAGAGRGMVVVSVDTPSGISGSTGEISPDPATNIPICIPAKHIACVGAPRIGLLRALQRHVSTETQPRPNWSLWVIDIGVNKAWKQFGSPGGRGVRFGPEWVVPLSYVADGE